MENICIHNGIRVFGMVVENFPHDIGAAFDRLANMIDDGFSRPYYGICESNNGVMIYRAATPEMFPGEGACYNCESWEIEKGNYLAVTVRDWRKHTESIKDIFNDMMEDNRVDFSKPFVEWYKSDAEMVCMVRELTKAMNRNT